MRVFLFAATVALLSSPAFAQPASDNLKRALDESRSPCRAVGRCDCHLLRQSQHPKSYRSRSLVSRIARRTSSTQDVQRRARSQDRYAVQLKTGLTPKRLGAAIATLRKKYNLKIVKTNKTLGILYVSPRSSAKAGTAPPPKTLGSALTPPIIQQLREEPFVDAAYVEFLGAPK